MTAKETRSRIQLLLGVTADGSFGPKTQTAYDELKIAGPNMEWPPKAPVPISTGSGSTFDERTEKNLKTLHTAAQPIFRSFLSLLIPHMAAKGVVAKVISGTRTYAEQDELYAHGRTKPGPKVTNAKGGQSNHNFGCAVDIGLFKDGDYLEDSPLYLEAGPIGKSVGLTWGGDWKSIKDYPHFEALQFKAPVL